MKKPLFALLLLPLLLPRAAYATTTHLTYDIAFWGLSVGDIHYTITQTRDTYSMTFDGGFGGLVGVVADTDGSATATGVIRDGRILPARLDQTVQWGEKTGKIFVRFDDHSNVVEYGATPHYSPEGRAPVTPNMLKDVRDSLSGLIQLPPPVGKDFCDRTVRVFDGRERFDLHFTPAGADMKCSIRTEQIGGYKLAGGTKPRPFKMTFTTIDGGQLAIPQKTVKSFALGEATIKLVKVETE